MSVFLEIHETRADRPWSYSDLVQRQKEWVVQDPSARGFLLSRVEPVITLGRRGWKSGTSPSELRVPILELDRGGFETFHHPGQWLIFGVGTIESWLGRRGDVRGWVRLLLEIGQAVASDLGVVNELRDREPIGLWNQSGEKLASVGIRIQDDRPFHGLALNVLPWSAGTGDHEFANLNRFGGIQPCGLPVAAGTLFDEASSELSETRMKQVLSAILDFVNEPPN